MDIEKVNKAITICDLARDYPQLKAIHDLALRALMKENEAAVKELEEIEKKEAEEKAKEEEKAAAEAKEEADKEAKANEANTKEPVNA